MSEPLDLEPIKARAMPYWDFTPGTREHDRHLLLAEVERLQRQIAAVRAEHERVLDDGLAWCDLDGTPWPCWTIQALDGVA